jgi:hypothetical protein
MKTYEVEFKATTYRQIVVDAKNCDEAEEKAWEELQLDTEVSASWVESAEVHTLVEEDED